MSLLLRLSNAPLRRTDPCRSPVTNRIICRSAACAKPAVEAVKKIWPGAKVVK